MEVGIFAAVRSLAEALEGEAEQPSADGEHQPLELVFAQVGTATTPAPCKGANSTAPQVRAASRKAYIPHPDRLTRQVF